MTNLKDIEQASYTAPDAVSDEIRKHYIVWNADRSEGFITNDYSDAVQTYNGEFYNPYSSLRAAFHESYGDDEKQFDTIYLSALTSTPSPEAVRREALELLAGIAQGQKEYWSKKQETLPSLEDGVSENGDEYTPLGDHVAWSVGAANGHYSEACWFLGTIRALQTTQPEPAVKVDEWQPIETAPRNGTLVDLWSNHDTRTANVKWVVENRDGARHPSLILDGWKTSSEDPYTILTESQFTHWMPLPVAPLNRIGGDA